MAKFLKSKKAMVGTALIGGLVGLIGWTGYNQVVAKPETYLEYKIDKHQKDTVFIENKFVYSTDVGHQKVILGMGGLWERVQVPGLNFRFPFETVYDVDVSKVTKLERGFRTKKAGIKSEYEKNDFSKESLMVTGDEGELKVQYILQYVKKDPISFLFNVRNPHETVSEVSESALREVIATKTYEEILTTEKEKIQSEAGEIAQNLLDDYGVGIKLISILLQPINPPTEKVQQSFDELNNAIQEKERLIQEGWKVYEKETKEAEGTKQNMVEQSKGEASEKVNIAEGRTVRFKELYDGYKKNPEANRFRIYQEVIRELLKDSEITIIDKEATGSLLQHLKIDKDKEDKK